MTLILAASLILLSCGILEPLASFGIFAGALWACLNLKLINSLAKGLLLREKMGYLKLSFLLAVKFPLLYMIGYEILTVMHCPLPYALAGFSLLFAALLFNCLARLPVYFQAGFALLASSGSLHASLTTPVPEVPNLFTLLYKGFESPFTAFLHHWESVAFSIILAAAIALLFCLGARRCKALPTTRFQNFLELIAEIAQKFARDILGPEGDKFVPFLGTLFIYILTMNWMVLLPFMKAPSSSLSITIALAICVFALVQYLSVRNFGFWGYLYHMAGSPKNAVGWAIVPLMLPIEVITQLSRPLTLALRLFGNVVGEDILIGAFALFGVTLFASLPVGLPLQMPFMLFAMFTGFMQASVFTLLSAIYILLSSPDPEDENH